MKKLSTFLVAACLSMMVSMTSFAGQWEQNTTGWWYQNDDGSYPASQWVTIDEKLYYFDADGYMKTGWVLTTQGNWYYLNPSGELRYDELTENGRVYNFDSNGRCTNHEDNGLNFENDYQSILNLEGLEARKRLMDQQEESGTYEEDNVYFHDAAPDKTIDRFGLADMQF
ncbi:hypothetical protein [Clostridium transplantifaecale]|uniref:hypothetical protein n=1 Tax=Clostridium transplantifaecale TaxID=2479838 RepID=UPI000F63BB47|nr:hypothetical protein [Clostridium transplantifaecale]